MLTPERKKKKKERKTSHWSHGARDMFNTEQTNHCSPIAPYLRVAVMTMHSLEGKPPLSFNDHVLREKREKTLRQCFDKERKK